MPADVPVPSEMGGHQSCCSSGLFAVSQVEAKPYVEAALGDRSQLVRRRAHALWSLYQQQNHFSATSVQFKGEVNDALPRKRHQQRHLEFLTAYLLSRPHAPLAHHVA